MLLARRLSLAGTDIQQKAFSENHGRGICPTRSHAFGDIKDDDEYSCSNLRVPSAVILLSTDDFRRTTAF